MIIRICEGITQVVVEKVERQGNGEKGEGNNEEEDEEDEEEGEERNHVLKVPRGAGKLKLLSRPARTLTRMSLPGWLVPKLELEERLSLRLDLRSSRLVWLCLRVGWDNKVWLLNYPPLKWDFLLSFFPSFFSFSLSAVFPTQE